MSVDERYRRGYADGMIDGARKLSHNLRAKIAEAVCELEAKVDSLERAQKTDDEARK